ncbi:MAG: hypothetical protein AAGA54_13290 [Myxococcota bacterium]
MHATGPASDPHSTGPHDGWPPRGYSPQPSRSIALDLLLDKAIDFALIFVGLYAALAVQQWQDGRSEKQAYISLLQDFQRELEANLDQETSIVKDLGAIENTEPGENLGSMQATFDTFFAGLSKDEAVATCLHEQFAAEDTPAVAHAPEGCDALYDAFETAHADGHASFSFSPAVLTPFYRKEVWQLYLADGVKTFRNKALAVDIAEVYANAARIEAQVEHIESTYNDAFTKQVARTAATDMKLAEIVHDERTHHALSRTGLDMLLHVEQDVKEERYGALEVQRKLELEVERMKHTVLLMRQEIEAVQQAIDEELASLGSTNAETQG